MTDNVVSRLKSNRAQGRPGGPSRRWRDTSEWKIPGVYYADLTLGGRAITVKLLVREHKRDSGTHARYLYTTDLQRGSRGGLPGRRSRSSKGRQGPGTPRSGGGRGFRVTSRSSP
ncbi:transposase [Metallosphaera yellowstonensis]|uniref:transposase n=1 Tax=Metallosphaera yellowstonensis TaxID=1111107 RepID=UPI001FE1917D|nr:transposase [Metallosphaera yellowstonensis]